MSQDPFDIPLLYDHTVLTNIQLSPIAQTENPSNTGISYELITQQIFQEILDQDSVRTIEVKHNVTIQGKTLTHQIDVFWDFDLGGIRYITVVQAKDWSTTCRPGKTPTVSGCS